MAVPSVNARYSGSVTYAAGDGTAPTAVSIGGTVTTANCMVIVTSSDEDTQGRERRHAWGHALTTTTIAFTRYESSFATECIIEWEVIEFDAGVNVQRGVVVFDSTSETVNITEVDGDLSLIHWNGIETDNNTGTEQFSPRRAFSTNVSGDDQLTFSRGTAPGTGEHDGNWEVVEFDEDVTIQRGSVTRTSSGTTSTSITTVDTTATFVSLEGLDTRHTFNPTGRNSWLVELTSTTNIDISQIVDTSNTTIFDWVVLEFTGGQTVESGTVAFAGTDTLEQPTFTSMTDGTLAPIPYIEPFTADDTGEVSGTDAGHRHLRYSFNGTTGVDVERALAENAWTAYWAAIDWDTGGGGGGGRIMSSLAHNGGLAGLGGIAGPGGGLAG